MIGRRLTNDGQASWRHVVFDRPYNQQSTTGLRLRGWDDPELGSIFAQSVSRFRRELTGQLQLRDGGNPSRWVTDGSPNGA